MKKLAIKFLLLAAPFLIAFIYVEHRLDAVPNSYNLKRKYFEAQLKDIQVLQLGGSHTFFGVDPSFFSYKGFNLANVSQTIYYDTRLATRYINQMPSLKMIIIPISYESYRDQLRTSTEKWREYYYYTYWGIDDPHISYLKAERYSKICLYTINEVKRFAREHFATNLAPDLQYNGFEKNDSAGKYIRINDSTGKERMNFLDHEIKESYREENINDLKKFLELANSKHIKVIFITVPVCSSYSRYADPKILADNVSLTRMLDSIYHSSYYNYFTDSRFSIDDFTDNDHLSFVGAAKFSKILDSEVIQPEMKLMTK